ncbi:MAG: GH3 auxin-responsive promoter family protein [Gammaproteobacteria bacterium]|nr:GH3 auxin-responsive promoter family protein [Gammaproteobacteria bacterium]
MTTALNRYLPWLWYPLLLGGAVLSHVILSMQGMTIVYSTYIPVVMAALLITTIETFFPYREEWKPDRAEVVTDSAFMVTVQVVLPQLLAYLAALALIPVMAGNISVWPSELPVFVQVIMMILIADFMRYWLHRACHSYMPLWQLHAVHHSPHKLYWLNVGRFHPVEKALQFLFDALPFIVLGIDETVLSLYFVFYAVNGYFQHSNIHLKFGWLNYLVSSAELHRWHHSIHVEESNKNLGNNIIIWDLVFGTYMLPKDREVGDLGLFNRAYPKRFSEQMKTPFVAHLESKPLPVISYPEILVNFLFKMRMLALYLTRWSRLIKSTHAPRRAQRELLQHIISTNKDTAFGQDHGFANIKDPESYSALCPIQSYDSLKKYMQSDGKANQGLTQAEPCFYQVTSGTTGSAKYLPMTAAGLENDKTQQNLFALARYLDNPSTYTGKIFAITSPMIEGYMDSGIPYGSASGLTYKNMPFMARLKYALPYPVFEIKDYNTKYLLIALFALAEPNVTTIATANPSTLLRLMEVVNTHSVPLLDMIATGIIEVPDLEQEACARLSAKLKANSERSRKLSELKLQKGRLTIADIWPHLQSLITWTGGSCGVALSSIKTDLPEQAQIIELGYLASECRGTLTIDHNQGLPTLTSNFFEFIERDDWEAERIQIRWLDELKAGKQYYVIVTTANGLYRYFMNDIVEVTGRYNHTPTLKFLQKGQGVTNITGEKLYESQAIMALHTLEETFGLEAVFHQWIADEENFTYRAYLEIHNGTDASTTDLSRALDQVLSTLNIEYQQKLASGRLKPIAVHLLTAGTGERYKQHHLDKGQREGQFKTLSLTYKKDIDFSFDAYVEH